MTSTATPKPPSSPTETAPRILRLTIERFRGIQKLEWYPEAGINIILGGGDAGKTTILDAIALLLSPTNNVVLADTDYWQRDVVSGFSIEAVVSLPDAVPISQQTKHAWPWSWNGKEPVLPDLAEGAAAATQSVDNPVYCVRVRGTPEFDVSHELEQPDRSADHFSANTRRSIGLVRLGGDDRNDRDLRLVQGSALDRLLSDKTLRARLGAKLAESDVNAELKAEGKNALEALNVQFEKESLPSGLGLGLTGGQGFSGLVPCRETRV